MSRYLLSVLRLVLAVAYAYGAVVHIANMVGQGGFDWAQAPLRWQLLDVIYLVLDVAVVWGLIFRLKIGLIVLTFAALSQILLYTVFRDWVLDVPEAYMPSSEEQAYLSLLVTFHLFTLVLVAFAVLRLRYIPVMFLIVPIMVFNTRPVTANNPIIEGYWASPGFAMVVHLEPCANDRTKTCGRFVWSWDGDDALKHKFGSVVLRDIRSDGERWRGKLLDPKTGRVYRGTLYKVDEHTLRLHGCTGPFCQKQMWRSVDSVTTTLLGIMSES